MIELLAVEVPEGWVGLLGVGLLSWMAYMAKQVTTQATVNSTTAVTLKAVVDDVADLRKSHANLDRKFIDYVDKAKDHRIEELELRLAEAAKIPEAS